MAVEGLPLDLKPAAHRQTRYEASPTLDPPEVLSLPEPTRDLDQAKEDLSVYGLCLYAEALSSDEVETLREALGSQAAAERALGDKAPPGAARVQQRTV